MEQAPNALGLMSMWLSGQSIADQTLWGVKVLWLGRAGKLIQFASACTILVELIGIKRIRVAIGIGEHLTPEEATTAAQDRAAKIFKVFFPCAFIFVALKAGNRYFPSPVLAQMLEISELVYTFVGSVIAIGLMLWSIGILLFAVSEHGIKWLAYFMFIVGFALDFLAS